MRGPCGFFGTGPDRRYHPRSIKERSTPLVLFPRSPRSAGARERRRSPAPGAAMSGEGVAPHRARRVKPRRRPVTDRERGIDAVCRDGEFVMPPAARFATPVVFQVNVQALRIYNLMADLMDLKLRCKSALNGPPYPWRFLFKLAIPELNKEIGLLRRQGLKLRKYVLDIESGKALNEPTQWLRV